MALSPGLFRKQTTAVGEGCGAGALCCGASSSVQWSALCVGNSCCGAPCVVGCLCLGVSCVWGARTVERIVCREPVLWSDLCVGSPCCGAPCVWGACAVECLVSGAPTPPRLGKCLYPLLFSSPGSPASWVCSQSSSPA